MDIKTGGQAAAKALIDQGVEVIFTLSGGHLNPIYVNLEDTDIALGASFDYLMQTGYLFGGWQLARSALIASHLVAEGKDSSFYKKKIFTAEYYCEQILSRCSSHGASVISAGGTLHTFPSSWL